MNDGPQPGSARNENAFSDECVSDTLAGASSPLEPEKMQSPAVEPEKISHPVEETEARVEQLTQSLYAAMNSHAPMLRNWADIRSRGDASDASQRTPKLKTSGPESPS